MSNPPNLATVVGGSISGGNNNAWNMSLRDYFAAQALVGLLYPGFEADSMDAPKQAYALADAMLAERAKGGGA